MSGQVIVTTLGLVALSPAAAIAVATMNMNIDLAPLAWFILWLLSGGIS